MQGYRPHSGKEYVKVRADCGLDGSIRPLKFRPENGPAVVIDRILDVRQAPALKEGGQGMRYTCRTGERTFCLFYDRSLWFARQTGRRHGDVRTLLP